VNLKCYVFLDCYLWNLWNSYCPWSCFSYWITQHASTRWCL